MSDQDTVSHALGAPITPAAIRAWQAHVHLAQTGLPDPPTLVAMHVYPAPKGQGGSSFFRALEATSSQIPQWAWLVGAAGAGAVAYFAYAAENKRGRR